MKYIPYGHQDITKEDIQEVVKILKSDFITQGPKIGEFEKEIASFTGAKYSVVFNSGTAALHAAYFAYGLERDDEFITSPMTFAATANAGLYLGAKPVFSDVEMSTGDMDPSLIEKHISKKTRLIVPIHYGGNPVNLGRISKIAKRHKIGIIEDACHALGGRYEGTKIGDCKYSEMCAFSFHPVKHITTGEGGAVTTNNKEYYERLITFRTHGITKDKLVNSSPGGWYYEMQFLGYNFRITDIQASLGLSQIKRLPEYIKRRREIAKIYDAKFKNNPYFDVQTETKGTSGAYHLYPIFLKEHLKDKKGEIFEELRKNGLGVQVHYIPVHFHPYYRNLGYKPGICPVAEDFYRREISIPMFPTLSDKDVQSVIDTILKVLAPFSADKEEEFKAAIALLDIKGMNFSKNILEKELLKIKNIPHEQE